MDDGFLRFEVVAITKENKFQVKFTTLLTAYFQINFVYRYTD
jgi:phage antirepressor YoqD-like protein